MIRKILAWFIKPGKEYTIENILKYALKTYLNKTKTSLTGYNSNGLCLCIENALVHYGEKIPIRADLTVYIPLFDSSYAIKYFKGSNRVYWWDTKDWWHRYKFMKWLIKQYKE